MSAVDLLLVGQEGNGKSSTGNSILNKKEFNVNSGSFPVSDDIILRSAEVHGRKVSVVDGISLRDTSTDSPAHVLDTISLAERAVQLFIYGFSALIIVLKYGVRFTQQERNAVRIIRSLFGEDAIKKYGVLVMTHGDNFASDMEDNKLVFDDWCRHQTGDIQYLFTECKNRCVLFNNRAKDTKQMTKQVQDLMSKVDEVKSRTTNYTLDSYKQARLGQRKLFVSSKLPELQKATDRVLDSVSQSLRSLNEIYYPSDSYLDELDSLRSRINEHKDYLQREDEGTNCISPLLLQISVTETSINTRRERHLRQSEYDSLISKSQQPTAVLQNTLLHNRVKLMIAAAGIVGIILVIVFVIFIVK